MSEQAQFGIGFNDLPDTSFIKEIELVNAKNKLRHQIANVPGKQASIKILYAIAQQNKNIITTIEAKQGLKLFGDYVGIEKQMPNSHPNIRLLLDTVAHAQEWQMKVLSYNTS